MCFELCCAVLCVWRTGKLEKQKSLCRVGDGELRELKFISLFVKWLFFELVYRLYFEHKR